MIAAAPEPSASARVGSPRQTSISGRSPAVALPFADGEFDIVPSCVGIMFAPHHQVAADEMLRVCRPGGTIGPRNWTPEGFIGHMFTSRGRTRRRGPARRAARAVVGPPGPRPGAARRPGDRPGRGSTRGADRALRTGRGAPGLLQGPLRPDRGRPPLHRRGSDAGGRTRPGPGGPGPPARPGAGRRDDGLGVSAAHRTPARPTPAHRRARHVPRSSPHRDAGGPAPSPDAGTPRGVGGHPFG